MPEPDGGEFDGLLADDEATRQSSLEALRVATNRSVERLIAWRDADGARRRQAALSVLIAWSDLGDATAFRRAAIWYGSECRTRDERTRLGELISEQPEAGSALLAELVGSAADAPATVSLAQALGATAVPVLVRVLESTAPAQRAMALRMLEALGSSAAEAVEQIAVAARSEAAETRLAGLACATRAAPSSPATRRLVLDFLSDPDASVRAAAVSGVPAIAGGLSEDELAAVIERASRDPWPDVRAAVVSALPQLPLPSDTLEQRAIEGARDRASQVRAAAMMALAQAATTSSAATAAIGEALQDDDNHTRMWALMAVSKSPTLADRLVSRVERCLFDENSRIAALQALFAGGRLSPQGIHAVVRVLGDAALAPLAIEILARQGAAAHAPLLASLEGTPSDSIRQQAALAALARMATLPDGAADPLERLAVAGDPGVQRAAVAALGAGAGSSPALHAALARVRESMTGDLRDAADDALAALEEAPATLVKRAVSLLNAGEAGGVARGISMVRRIGRDAVPALCALLQSRDDRRSVLQALGAIARSAVEAVDPVSRLPRLEADEALLREFLVRVGAPGVPALLAAIDSEAARSRAPDVIGRIGEAALPGVLAALSADDGVAAQQTKLECLGVLGVSNEQVRAPLIAALANPSTASVAMSALARVGDPGGHAVEGLRRAVPAALASGDADAAHAGCRALARCGPAGRSALQAWIATAPEICVMAAGALGVAGEEGVSLLLDTSRSPDEDTRATSLAGLRIAAALPPAALDRVIAMLRDDSGRVRARALEVVERHGRESGPAAAGVLGCLESRLSIEPAAQRRAMVLAAVRAVRALGPLAASSVTEVAAVAGESDPVLLGECVAALRAIGEPSRAALPALREILARTSDVQAARAIRDLVAELE